jgi:hypothetical protein
LYIRQNYNSERVLTSIAANKRLLEQGIDIGNFLYTRTDERILNSVIKDNPKIQDLVRESRNEQAWLIQERLIDLQSQSFSESQVVIRYIYGKMSVLWEIEDRWNYDSIVYVNYEKYMSLYDHTDTQFIKMVRAVCSRSGKNVVISSVFKLDVNSIPVSINKGNGTYLYDGDEYEVKLFMSRLVKGLATKSVIPDTFRRKFSWLKGIHVTDGEEVPYKMRYAPVAGTDKDLADMIRRVGVSSRGDLLQLRLNKELITLVSDREFPSDIRSETIVDMISDPRIMSDTNLIASVLMAMGADSAKAMALAIEVFKVTSRFQFSTTRSGYSTRDAIVGFADLSQTNLHRLMTFDKSVPDERTTTVLKSVISVMCLTNKPGTSLKHKNVHWNSNDIDNTVMESIGIEAESWFKNIHIFGQIHD